MDATTLDLIQKITLIPAVIIAIVVVYRDSKQATTDRFEQQNLRIADLTKEVMTLNERIDSLLTNQALPK